MIRNVRRWWTQSSPQQLLAAQDRLLQHFVRSPAVATRTTSAAGMNAVEFQRQDNVAGSGKDTIVLAHGFGSGLGFFAHNVDPLLQHPSVGKVILVDWLGMGGSERPACYQAPIRGWWTTDGDDGNPSKSWCDSRFTPSEAVKFFVDPFHEWMNQSVLPDSQEGGGQVVLVGHSLGGYLSARYVLEYPSVVHKLVLASPVGFPIKPKAALKGSQLPSSLRVVDALWSSNLTPQQLVRMMGATRGRRNIQRMLQGRMPQLQQAEAREAAQLLGDYLYHITVADPSGEFAMNSLLEPVVSPDIMGVFARQPLQQLFKGFDEDVRTTKESIALKKAVCLFGDHDWMRPNEMATRAVFSQLNNNSSMSASVHIIENAGHHLYLDNAASFERHIVS